MRPTQQLDRDNGGQRICSVGRGLRSVMLHAGVACPTTGTPIGFPNRASPRILIEMRLSVQCPKPRTTNCAIGN